MTKKELAAIVAKKTEINQENARKYTDAVLDAIKDSLSSGENVSLIGFGTFSVVERAAREARNPKTGKKLKVPARKAVKFNVGKNLKEAVEK